MSFYVNLKSRMRSEKLTVTTFFVSLAIMS